MNYIDSRRSLIETNGFALSMTTGRSMRPLIWGGQHCVAVAPLKGHPSKGDLLMFRHRLPDGKRINVVHRVVEFSGACDDCVYITRGDNCLGIERVSPSELIGRVVEIHRVSGYRPWHIIPSKKISVNDPAYRIYTRIWLALWPARRIAYLLRAHVYGLYSRLRSILSNSTSALKI